MKKYFFMGLGCATGIALIFVVLFAITYFSISGSVDREIHYFDVTTAKGTYNLHLKMPKDSVLMLVGEPDDKSLNTILNDVEEKYYYKKDESRQLVLTFTNGVLNDVMDY